MTRALITQMLEALDTVAAYGSPNKECARLGYKEREAARAYLAAPEQSEPEIEYYGLEPWEVAANVPVATMIYPKHSPDKPFVALGNCVSLYPEAAQVKLLYTTPQPTAPEPVNQMLLEALKELLEANSYYFPIGNPWGDKARAAIAAAEQSPQPELTDEQIRAIVYDTRHNGIYATVRACIAATQKGNKCPASQTAK